MKQKEKKRKKEESLKRKVPESIEEDGVEPTGRLSRSKNLC